MIAALLSALAAFEAAPVSVVEMGDIEVRLFYKYTGRLSENILDRKEEFAFHNTIIGAGDAEEAADDLLVSVRMTSGRFGTPEDKQRFVEAPVELIARDATGRILGRRIHKSVLTSFEGVEHKVLWLSDVTCAGEVTLTASFGGRRKSAKIVMGCGE